MNEKLKIENNKILFPQFSEKEIGYQIFGRILQIADWVSLGRASMVCRNWYETIKNNTSFHLCASVLNKQTLHTSTFMKFYLAIAGDQRKYHRFTVSPQKLSFWKDRSNWTSMSRWTFLKHVRELNKPLPLLLPLAEIKYDDNATFTKLVKQLSAMKDFPSPYEISNKELNDLNSASKIFYNLLERQKICDKINDAIEVCKDCFYFDFKRTMRIIIITAILSICFYNILNFSQIKNPLSDWLILIAFNLTSQWIDSQFISPLKTNRMLVQFGNEVHIHNF